MRNLLFCLAIVLSGTATAQTCTAVTSAPRLPTLLAEGDSLMQGNLCSVTGPISPPAYLDANLPGGATEGWLIKNAGVTGQTPAQIRATYTAGEATACNGDRCAHLVLEGGVNCLRTGTAAATCLADLTWVVDDALSKGYAVLWLDVTDYSLWASAGTTPTAQATAYNAAWQAACTARASNLKLKCLSLYSVMGVPLTNTCDGVHDNQTGTNLRGARMLTALQSIP